MGGIFVSLKEGSENNCPVILVHGDYQNHTIFRWLENYFIEREHTTASIDLPGHGLSETRELDLSGLLEDIILRENLRNPVIIGNSFGGLLAVDYAKKGRVSSLVLLNSPILNMAKIYPNINWNAKLSEYETISGQFFERQSLVDYSEMGYLSEDELTQFGLKTTSPLGVRNNMRFYRFFNEHHNIDLNVPVLFITSEKDELVPKDYLKKWIDENKKRKLEPVSGSHNVLIQSPQAISAILEKHYSFLFSDTV